MIAKCTPVSSQLTPHAAPTPVATTRIVANEKTFACCYYGVILFVLIEMFHLPSKHEYYGKNSLYRK
jgi:hypothetical protein